MNIYDRMRQLIDQAERVPQDVRRYQVRHAASGLHGIIVDTWATEWENYNVHATGISPADAALTIDTAKVVTALLNLGYPPPVNPAVAQLIMAFMPEAKARDTAREDLFDSIQVAVTAMLQREAAATDITEDVPHLGLCVRRIVENTFAYRPEQRQPHVQ